MRCHRQREMQPLALTALGAHGEVLLQHLVPFTLLPFHFLLLIMFALIWVFGRRIKEK